MFVLGEVAGKAFITLKKRGPQRTARKMLRCGNFCSKGWDEPGLAVSILFEISRPASAQGTARDTTEDYGNSLAACAPSQTIMNPASTLEAT